MNLYTSCVHASMLFCMEDDIAAFPQYVRRQLDRLDWTVADLARAAELPESTVGRWVRGKTVPGIDSARQLAEALRRPLLEVLVAAGLITAEEAKQRTVARHDPADLTNEQIAAEVARRLDAASSSGRSTRKREPVDVTKDPNRFTSPHGRRRGGETRRA